MPQAAGCYGSDERFQRRAILLGARSPTRPSSINAVVVREVALQLLQHAFGTLSPSACATASFATR